MHKAPNHVTTFTVTLLLATIISGLYYFKSLQFGTPVSALAPTPSSLMHLLYTVSRGFKIQIDLITPQFKTTYTVIISLRKRQSPYNVLSGFTKLALFYVFDLISYSVLATVASLLFLEPAKHTLISDPAWHLVFPLPAKFLLQDNCLAFFLIFLS